MTGGTPDGTGVSEATTASRPDGASAASAETGSLDPVKTFDDLFQELTEKARTRPEGSGTVAELDAGVHQIGKKIVEEAAEVWMAAEYEGDERTSEEISQLVYHLQVLMVAKGLTPADVWRHLQDALGHQPAHRPRSATTPTRKQTPDAPHRCAQQGLPVRDRVRHAA